MRSPFPIFAAAAAIVSALARQAVGDTSASTPESDGPSPIPPISARLVEQYAMAGATDADIADRFLVDVEQVRERYQDVLRVARAVRRIGIHGQQSELARKHNGPMLTWLGRNELGQSLTPAEPGMPAPREEMEMN